MNCKPGDVAEIIEGANKGALVTVLSYDEILSRHYGEHLWEVRPAWPVLSVVGSRAGTYVSEATSCHDKVLRPIRADPIPEKVDTENEVSA